MGSDHELPRAQQTRLDRYEIVDPGNMVIANGSASLGVVNSTYLAQTLVTVANLSSSGWYQTSVALYYLDANSQYTHLDNYSTNWYVASGSTSTGCGHDPTYAYLNVSYPGNLEVGDDLNLMASSYCNLLNETMVLEYDLRSPSNTSISSGSWNWTAYYLSDTHWVNYSNLDDVGYHTLHVDLWHIDGNGSWSLLDVVTLWIWVGSATRVAAVAVTILIGCICTSGMTSGRNASVTRSTSRCMSIVRSSIRRCPSTGPIGAPVVSCMTPTATIGQRTPAT